MSVELILTWAGTFSYLLSNRRLRCETRHCDCKQAHATTLSLPRFSPPRISLDSFSSARILLLILRVVNPWGNFRRDCLYATILKPQSRTWTISIDSKLCFVWLYRVAQNYGEQVVRISSIKFHLLTFQFVVIPHGKRDLSSLPEAGEAAVQISWEKESCWAADAILSRKLNISS